MEKQYYAILMRNTNFNIEKIDEEKYNNYSLDELSDMPAKIIVKKDNYNDAYNEFQKLKNSYPQVKLIAEENNMQTDFFDIELSIARISIMKDWETLK